MPRLCAAFRWKVEIIPENRDVLRRKELVRTVLIDVVPNHVVHQIDGNEKPVWLDVG